MRSLPESIIQQAYHDGNCVIVGRGSQCILQHKPDAFHVFVYAPHRERILQACASACPKASMWRNASEPWMKSAPNTLQQNWGKYWLNPHLYDLMISSRDGEQETARIIQSAMTGAPHEMLTSK